MFDFRTRCGPERICVCILFHFVESKFRSDVAPASNSSEVMLFSLYFVLACSFMANLILSITNGLVHRK